MIKLKDLLETDSLYNEPTDIKKRLGGRYGGEPEKAIANPGNKKPALSAKKKISEAQSKSTHKKGEVWKDDRGGPRPWAARSTVTGDVLHFIDKKGAEQWARPHGSFLAKRSRKGSVKEAVSTRGQTLADLGHAAVGKTARVTVGFTHNGVSIDDKARGKVMAAPVRRLGRVMVKIKFDLSTVARNQMFKRTLIVPASHLRLIEAVADAKDYVTPEDSHKIEKDLGVTTNSPKMFETETISDINETEKAVSALGRLLNEKIRKLPFGMSVGKQSEYRTQDDWKIIRKFMFAGRSLRIKPRWTSAKELERALGSRSKVADWLKHTNLKVSRQSYKGEPGFQIQPVGKDYAKMMQHGEGITEAKGVDNPFDSHDMSWAKTKNPGSPKTPVGEVQKKLMMVLHGLGYGDHQLADLVRSPEFRNVHFKRIQTAASALKKKQLVNYDGTSKVSLVEANQKALDTYKGWKIFALTNYTTPYYYPEQHDIKGRKVGGPAENYPGIRKVKNLIDKWLKQMGKESLDEAESWGKNISDPNKIQIKKQQPKPISEAKKVPTTEWFYSVIYIKRLRDKGKRNEAEYASAFLNWIGRSDSRGQAKGVSEPQPKGVSAGAAQSIKQDIEKILQKSVHWIDPEEAERLMKKHQSPGEGPVVPKVPSRHGGESPIDRLRNARPSGWKYK